MSDLDDIDRGLILALATDATQTAGALGRRFGLSQPATWRRIKRLYEAGILKGRKLDLDAEKLGFGVTVFLGVKLATKGRVSLEDFERAVSAIPEVQTVQDYCEEGGRKRWAAVQDLLWTMINSKEFLFNH
mgnify:CR=1 FL=1